MDFKLRFWAENITAAEIVEQALPLLKEFDAGVGVSLYEDSLTDENAKAFARLKSEGIELTYWPLLSLPEGYFPNERSVEPFSNLVEYVLEWSSAEGIQPDMLAFDLEIPFWQMQDLLTASPRKKLARALSILRENLDLERYLEARNALSSLNDRVRAQGIKTITAVFPWVALELDSEYELLQDLTETPLAGVHWDIFSPMLYVSMLEGLTGGLVSYRDANWLTFITSLRLFSKFGSRAGASLGVTGTGVLGNEPAFRYPEGLLPGVEAALAAGIRDISIYNLEGILASGEPRRWLEMIRGARPTTPQRSGRVNLALAIGADLHPLATRLAYGPISRLFP